MRIVTACLALIAYSPLAYGQSNGYDLTPKNTGGGHYSDAIKTPIGVWTLEFSQDDCNIHSTCDAVLFLTKSDKKRTKMAVVSMSLGSTAVLSKDYRTVQTNEIDDSDHGPVGRHGSYDVTPAH